MADNYDPFEDPLKDKDPAYDKIREIIREMRKKGSEGRKSLDEFVQAARKEVFRLTQHLEIKPYLIEDLGDRIRILGKLGNIDTLNFTPINAEPGHYYVTQNYVYADRRYEWKDNHINVMHTDTFRIFPKNAGEALLHYLSCGLYGRCSSASERWLESQEFWRRCKEAKANGAKPPRFKL
jgi:hypothetical protein